MTGNHEASWKCIRNTAVTTSHRTNREHIEKARLMAAKLEIPYVDRNGQSLETLYKNYQLNGIIVVSFNKLSYVSDEQEFFFHTGLASLRINAIRNGKTDQMICAMGLKAGDSVLDCTLGLGSDAIVASYVAGNEGNVTGIENSLIIAELVRQGLASYTGEDEVIKTMRHIKVVNAEHKQYLAGLPPGSYDIVYFDPMFRQPKYHSSGINSMRILAIPDPVDFDTIVLAKKVASKRVVLKERRGSLEFDRLGFNIVYGGKYAPVAYGVIECGDFLR